MTSIMSMTGFGQAERTSDLGTFAIEIKSVNHRHLELKAYLPREMAHLELAMQRAAKARLGRGKVDISVRWVPSATYIPKVSFNRALVLHYQSELANVATPLQREDKVSFEFLLNLPGVMERETALPDEDALTALAIGALDEALDNLIVQRKREGEALEDELRMRLDKLEQMRSYIESRREDVIVAYRERLMKKAEEWAQMGSVAIEPGRLETEVLLYAERSDITEELVRLKAHLEAFHGLLDNPTEPQGKPIEFLTQELLRETNTVASKTRDLAIGTTVLEMKNEIEKIREQSLNVE